jgi:hypothetical protein
MRSALFWDITQRRVVKDYHSTLHNIPEQCRSHQHHDGSMTSCTVPEIYAAYVIHILGSFKQCVNHYSLLLSYRDI